MALGFGWFGGLAFFFFNAEKKPDSIKTEN